MPNTLDLSRFARIIPTRLPPADLEAVRYAFASRITDHATTCDSNNELLSALHLTLLPEGLNTPVCIGRGSTRTVWSLPFGLVMKLESTRTLDTAAMQLRGNQQYLQQRRRISSFREATTAIRHPLLFPAIYGWMFAFGEAPPNPSCLIMEHVAPLSDVFGDDDDDFLKDAMCVCPSDGRLRIYDRRLTTDRHPASDRPCLGCFMSLFVGGETVNSVENVGLDADGNAYLLDGGNYVNRNFVLDVKRFIPLREEGHTPFYNWMDTPPWSPLHEKQTREISEGTYRLYRQNYDRAKYGSPWDARPHKKAA